MNRRLAAASLVGIGLTILLATPLAAQYEQSAGIWLGGAVIGPEQPAAQLGARLELSPGSRVWLGVDGGFALVLFDEDDACFSTADCGYQVGPTPNLSAIVRYEPIGERVRPYAFAMAGATFPHFGTSALWGGGAGVRAPHLLGRLDLALEWRYRRVERFATEWGGDRELMLGVHLR